MSQKPVVVVAMTWFKSMGFTREERIEYINLMLGTDHVTSKGLTEPEWHRIMDGLRAYNFLRTISDVRQPLLGPLGVP